MLIAETLGAGLTHGHHLWFGLDRNVGRSLTTIATEMDITIHVLDRH
ncbi:hypothetical protein [Iamia sp.]|nr:hypothetical protein [Iamia sp.]HXH56926.1 hypothetical protein [Iamia sp.]